MLKDLLLCDQINKWTGSKIRDNFMVEWDKIVNTLVLVDKLDEYEAVHRIARKTNINSEPQHKGKPRDTLPFSANQS